MAEQEAPRVAIRHRVRRFEGFLNVDEVTFVLRADDGTWGDERRNLILERGNSAAILLYNVERHSVILVKQFRLAAFLSDEERRGDVLEIVAGIVDSNETPEDCAIREAQEETGYHINGDIQPIATVFPSPGGSTEKIHIYFAKISDADRLDDDGGVPSEGEQIKVIEVPFSEFERGIRDRCYSDSKTLIAGYWLLEHVGKQEARYATGEVAT